MDTFDTDTDTDTGARDAGCGVRNEADEESTNVLHSAPHPAPRTPAVTAARSHGEVHVVSRVVGFKKIKFYTNENIGSGELDLPEQQMHTTAYWLTLPRELMASLPFSADDRCDGVTGLSFAMRQVAQLLLMWDGQDIGISIGTGDDGPAETPDPARAASRRTLAELVEPRVFVYDNYPGGIGFSEPLFGMH